MAPLCVVQNVLEDNNMIPIVEIYPTCQMEGPFLGTPALFVRVGGCDLRCRFNGECCDTPYAVYTPKQLDVKNPKLKYGYDKWDQLTSEQLTFKIAEQAIKHIVFTGGHPMLYQGDLIAVIEQLNALYTHRPYTFEFETQGTIAVHHLLSEARNVFFNVSVKLKSSNQEDGYDGKRINVVALNSFPESRSVYKFVISDPKNDLNEIEQILQHRKLLTYLMPQGMTRDEVLRNSEEVIRLCIEYNFKFTPREHVNVWDSKKGV